MRSHHKSRVVVTDDAGKPVGIVSLADVARADAPDAARTLTAVAAREVLGPGGRPSST
jgi:CBS domain-containing protein